MAYAQWVVIHIINSFRQGTISLKNAQAMWGKFYKNGNKDAEIGAGEVNETTVAAGSEADISSCGRSDAASGTEGKVDVFDGDTQVCTIYWNCPWGSKSNDFQIQNRNNDYGITVGEWNRDSGALGKVDVDVSKKG
ncbi:Aegerolysin family protein [Didymella exigua CBS 183.55]|uniref:Aegerolysin family protein n=1 Tax=Didymella exigua CBS 183.55 TaxID=1150837 RepID=A0A6A5RZ58_9PLEO|nr:Aegerolysin family protein [Didymella exigua CBS 183.55]KAF1933691.1 Aegerolysin family protein [Didymella exigua CBS 183.55]